VAREWLATARLTAGLKQLLALRCGLRARRAQS
jgi:hypothetical protein